MNTNYEGNITMQDHGKEHGCSSLHILLFVLALESGNYSWKKQKKKN